MTRSQKTVFASTTLIVAASLYLLFCDLQTGLRYTGNENIQGGRTHTIIQLGNEAGVVSRSRETIVRDGLMGIVVPIMLVGSALFVVVSPTRDAVNREPRA